MGFLFFFFFEILSCWSFVEVEDESLKVIVYVLGNRKRCKYNSSNAAFTNICRVCVMLYTFYFLKRQNVHNTKNLN